MTVDVSRIYLLDVATAQPVEAELRDAIEEAQLDDWQLSWMPELVKLVYELMKAGRPFEWPQSAHWDWRDKISSIKGLLGVQVLLRCLHEHDTGTDAGGSEFGSEDSNTEG